MHRVMTALVENIRSGVTYEAGNFYDRVFEEGPCKFVSVAKRWYSPLLGYAIRFYGNDKFPVLQVIWPTPNLAVSRHRSSIRLLQPNLVYPDIHRARMRRLLDAINSAPHAHFSAQRPPNQFPGHEEGKEKLTSLHTFKAEDWPFGVSENTKAYTTMDIVRGKNPILGVVHADDGTWQILSGVEISKSEVTVACLGCLFEFDRSIGQVADLPQGWEAWREGLNKPWQRTLFTEDPEGDIL